MIRLTVAAILAAGLAAAPLAQSAPKPVQVDLSGAFNKDCVATKYVLPDGNCDNGILYASYVADTFPTGSVTKLGQTFRMPPAGTGNQSLAGAGQTVKVKGATKGLSYLHVLGTGVNVGGGTKAPCGITVVYTDGSKQAVNVGLLDWVSKGKAVLALPSQSLLDVPGVSNALRYGYIDSVKINPTKTVKELTFSSTGGNIRIWALTLSPTTTSSTGPVFN